MVDVQTLQFALRIASVKLEPASEPSELKNEGASCGQQALVRGGGQVKKEEAADATLTSDDVEFHSELLHNISRFREQLIKLLSARRLISIHISPQMAYDLEALSDKEPVVWLASGRKDGFRLEEVLGEMGITAFSKPSDKQPHGIYYLTSEARDWIKRAYSIYRCEQETKQNWLSEDRLSIDTLRNYDSFDHQIERFLDNKLNVSDWARVVKQAPTKTPTQELKALSDEELAMQESIQADLTKAPEYNSRLSQALRDSILEERRQDPRYVLQLERGRTNITTYGRAEQGSHGPHSMAGQNQFELRENLPDYDDDIYSYLLLRRELAQCSASLEKSKAGLVERKENETADERAYREQKQQEHRELILGWREKLMTRGLDFGVSIFQPAANGNGFEITPEGMEFASGAVKAFEQEERRGIGHSMEDYKERRALFLSDVANASEWASLIAARQHKLAEESRVKPIKTLHDLQKHDDTVKFAFLSAAAQEEPYTPSFWLVLRHIEETSTDSYYDKLVLEFRTKLGKLANILSLYDVRTKEALGLSSDTHQRQPYQPEFLPIEGAVVVGDTRLNLLIEAAVSGLPTPTQYIQTAPLHLLEHTLNVLSNPAMVITHEKRYDIPKWASEFWQVATPPLRPYMRQAPAPSAPLRTAAAKTASSKRRPQKQQLYVDVVAQPPEPAPQQRPTTDAEWKRIIDYSLPFITPAHAISIEAAHRNMTTSLLSYLKTAIGGGADSTAAGDRMKAAYNTFMTEVVYTSPTHGPKTIAALHPQLLAQRALAPATLLAAEKMIGTLMTL